MGGTPEFAARLKYNLDQVHARIADACHRSGRRPENVTLVAVTKYAPIEFVRALITLGQLDLGENRPQQLIERANQLRDAPRKLPGGQITLPNWHLIGQLQRNKVRAVLPVATLIHSVDSRRLLQRIGDVAAELRDSGDNRTPRVLLQVNISGEKSKSGFSVEELTAAWDDLHRIPHVEIAGLMTMAPLTEDDDVIRKTFRGLRLLRDQLQARTPEQDLPELSMGMSHDFEIALEEGATLVRLGSVLFEGCQLP